MLLLFGIFFVAGAVVGRWWVVALAPAAFVVNAVGLVQNWWGPGVVEGWPLVLAWLGVVAATAAVVGLVVGKFLRAALRRAAAREAPRSLRLAAAALAFVSVPIATEYRVPPNSELELADLEQSDAPPTYFVGERFEGLPITAILGRPPHVSIFYGDCDIPIGFDPGGCAPPLDLQHVSSTERPPRPPCRRAHPNVPAAFVDGSDGLEVYVSDLTVVVFADNEDRAVRAAAALRPVKGQPRLPRPRADVVRDLAECDPR